MTRHAVGQDWRAIPRRAGVGLKPAHYRTDGGKGDQAALFAVEEGAKVVVVEMNKPASKVAAANIVAIGGFDFGGATRRAPLVEIASACRGLREFRHAGGQKR